MQEAAKMHTGGVDVWAVAGENEMVRDPGGRELGAVGRGSRWAGIRIERYGVGVDSGSRWGRDWQWIAR